MRQGRAAAINAAMSARETATTDKECGDPGCEHDHAQVPFRHETPPPGRNDPCLCGSGKKYKKCCLGSAA